MKFQRKPVSLLELCIRRVIDNLRYVSSMDGVEMQLLERILPHCTLEQLTHIENHTEMDISPATDELWKRFYRVQFGEESTNFAVEKLKQTGAQYKWKDLFKAKSQKQKELLDTMAEKLAKKYRKDKAERESKQIKLCTKEPPSRKRNFFGGSGPSNISNCSYKSPMLKKAKMEANSHAKMQSAANQRNTIARSSNGQSSTTTIHQPKSTITINRPIGSNRLKQNTRPKF